MCLLQFARFSRRNPRSGNPMMASRLDSADQEKPPSCLLLVLVPVLVFVVVVVVVLLLLHKHHLSCLPGFCKPWTPGQNPVPLSSESSKTLSPKPYQANSFSKNKKSQPRQAATKVSLRISSVALFSPHLLMLNSALSSLALALSLSLSQKLRHVVVVVVVAVSVRGTFVVVVVAVRVRGTWL